MRRVLVLRPEPGATATAERARARGLDPIVRPLFEVRPLPWEPPDPGGYDALLLTSANAVRWGGERLHGLRRLAVHAVGEATADAARSAGFEVASVGASDLAGLLDAIPPELRLLHPCGEHRTAAVRPRRQITAIPVYRAEALPLRLQAEGVEGAVALVHSPRAAARFAALVDEAGIDRCTVAIVAISAAAAGGAGDGWAAVEAAETPNDDALLALAARLCNKSARQ